MSRSLYLLIQLCVLGGCCLLQTVLVLTTFASAAHQDNQVQIVHVHGCEIEAQLRFLLHPHNNSLMVTVDSSTSSSLPQQAAADKQQQHHFHLQIWLWGDSFLYSTMVSNDVSFHGGLPGISMQGTSHEPGSLNDTSIYYLRVKRIYEMYEDKGDDLHSCLLSISPGNFTLYPNPKATSRVRSRGVWRYQLPSESFDPLTISNFSSLTYQLINTTHSNTSLLSDVTGNGLYHAYAPHLSSRYNRYGLQNWVRNCLRDIRYVIVGDSHMKRAGILTYSEMIGNTLIYNLRYQRLFLLQGLGIYHNIAVDLNPLEYQLGRIPAQFVPGTILSHLQDGNYSNIALEGNYKIWVFNSGHYDLRDANVDAYLTHLDELFPLLAQFQQQFNLSIIWNGNAPFSYRMKQYLKQEHRSNPAIALAEDYVQTIAKKYGITYVNQFDALLPFYSFSCDDHHYLCPEFNRLYRTSHLGLINIDALLEKVCSIAAIK